MTQNTRILEILSDGQEHEKSEFYSFCVLHSRISELRERGHSIEYRRDGDRHLYRLASLGVEAGHLIGAGRPASTPSESDVALSSLLPEHRSRSAPEQLTVWSEAAA